VSIRSTRVPAFHNAPSWGLDSGIAHNAMNRDVVSAAFRPPYRSGAAR
jgi:hypothetical protein